MATQKFTGVIPPVVVPDTEDHQLDVASFERSINRMIDAGVDGLFFLGSSGEVVFSTDERRRQIVAEAVRIVDHRVPVLVGIIDTETERMIEHGKVAQELGADALVATCPFYALQGMTEVGGALPHPSRGTRPAHLRLRHPRVRPHQAPLEAPC